MKPKAVVERYLAEVLNGGQVEAEAMISHAQFRERVRRFKLAFPDLEAETRAIVVEGDLVGVHLVGRAHHRGLFQGVPATGRAWEAACTAIYRIEDGRISDAWVNWDLLALMEQLGAIERVQTVSA